MTHELRRRAFLGTLTAAATAGLAGCSILSDDDSGALEQQLKTQNQTISELRADLANITQERDEFEQRVTEFEQEIEQQESGPARDLMAEVSVEVRVFRKCKSFFRGIK